ncbi:MAG TPA: hypothetical protein VJ724_08470 [Tahibacter sp.]|nr:hypothetical protein [Tahibacter sp.]
MNGNFLLTKVVNRRAEKIATLRQLQTLAEFFNTNECGRVDRSFARHDADGITLPAIAGASPVASWRREKAFAGVCRKVAKRSASLDFRR